MTHPTLSTPQLSPELWTLNPALTFLNHGSFGACPRDIIAEYRRYQDLLERSPVAFFVREAPALLSEARSRFARELSAPPEGLCLVTNASEGVATTLSALDWEPGDEVVISRDGYGACKQMLRALSARFGVVTRLAPTPFAPVAHAAHVAQASVGDAEAWRQEVVRGFESVSGPSTRLWLIDHITSPTALIFPVERLVERARALGVVSLVDGAHAPGHVEVDVGALGADFYTGNAHKWLMSPKGCAALYISERGPRGEAWRERVTPLVVSHGYSAPPPLRLHALFDWTGTRDLSAWCALPYTLGWLEARGGWRALASRNRALALAARALLVEALWGAHSPPLPPEGALGQMAAVPLPGDLVARARALSGEQAGRYGLHPLQQWLFERGVEVPVIPAPYEGAPDFIRVSAQAYNALPQYERLAELLRALRAGQEVSA
jgi:isopenicillin-N epimerase